MPLNYAEPQGTALAHRVCEKNIRGLNTAWLEAGTAGRPIVMMLHGFPDSAECWDRQIDFFAEDYHVVAPYVRGAKPSEPSRDMDRYSPEAIALDFLDILLEVNPERDQPVFIVGHDLGGVPAWQLARLIQSRAAGLVIINSLTIKQMFRRFKQPRQLLKSWYMLPMQVPKIPELLMRRFPIYFLDAAHSAGELQGAARPGLSSLRGALAGPMNQYRTFLRAIPKELRQKQKRLQTPVLVLWGSDDAFLVPPTLDEMETEAEKVTVRILPGNHWIHRSESVQVNKLMAEFFATRGAS